MKRSWIPLATPLSPLIKFSNVASVLPEFLGLIWVLAHDTCFLMGRNRYAIMFGWAVLDFSMIPFFVPHYKLPYEQNGEILSKNKFY